MPKRKEQARNDEPELAVYIEGVEEQLNKPYVDGSWELLRGLVCEEEIEELQAFALKAAKQRNRERL